MAPVVPPKKAMGTNTADSTIAIPTSAPWICFHRFSRRFARREPFLAHNAFDVFDHDNGVIDQQADSQHRREHRQGVNTVTAGVKHREGAHQYHRHGDGRDQGRAEVLQEQIHDQEHQQNRLQQRFYYIGNRGFYKRGGLVGDFILQPVRKIIATVHQDGR